MSPSSGFHCVLSEARMYALIGVYRMVLCILLYLNEYSVTFISLLAALALIFHIPKEECIPIPTTNWRTGIWGCVCSFILA